MERCSDGVYRMVWPDNGWRQIISQQLSRRMSIFSFIFFYIFVRSIRSPAGSALRRGPPLGTFLLCVSVDRSLVILLFTTRF